jgi:hypothetical protein
MVIEKNPFYEVLQLKWMILENNYTHISLRTSHMFDVLTIAQTTNIEMFMA